MLERDVAKAIDQYLARIGLRAFRADPGGKTGRTRPRSAGLPDRFGVLPNGRFWGIEIKGPESRARADQPKQLEVLNYLRVQNAIIIVARSVEDVMACEALCPSAVAPRFKSGVRGHYRDEVAGA